MGWRGGQKKFFGYFLSYVYLMIFLSSVGVYYCILLVIVQIPIFKFNKS